MNRDYLTSADFWKSEECYVAGDFPGTLPEIGRALVFRTSGSTGEGKWIVIGKKHFLHSAKAVNEWLKVDEGSVWGLCLPLHHVGGFSILARAFLAGSGLATFEQKWDPQEFRTWVEREHVTHVSLVPTQVHDFVAKAIRSPDTLKVAIVGGGRLSEAVGRAARELGWPVLATYGMTETSSQVATQSLQLLKEPYDGNRLELLPNWQGSVTKQGLLKLKGKALFSGVLEKSGDQWIFQKRNKSAYVTNDRAELDGRMLRLLGRSDSLVKVLGELVDLEQIEAAFLTCAGGALSENEIAVVSRRASRRENELILVLESSVENAEQHFARYQRMSPGLLRFARWIQIPQLPRSELGKLRRKKLAETIDAIFNGGTVG